MKPFVCVAAALGLVATAGLVSGCGDVNAALEQLTEARQRSADLLVQFTKATDAANRAVMADTDAQSVAFAREADLAKQGVQQDVDSLGPTFTRLGYTEEAGLLREFSRRFAEYSALDRRILDLAVENTNLKARGLSFGPVQDAAETFRTALERAGAAAAPQDAWHARALVAQAVSAVREIQVWQAPHIAEADDALMARMERDMSAAEATARGAIAALTPLVAPGARSQVAAATTAFEHFMDLNTQLIALSRRNTNVRSLALSLDEKQKLITPCEESLRGLRAALAKRGYPSGR